VDTNILLTNHHVFTSYRIVIVVWCDLGLIVNAIPRPKKIPVVPVSRPTLFFFAHPIIFSTRRLTVRSYFLRVVAGGSHSVPKWCLLSQQLLNQIA
jgi:hypothetical protein